MAYDEGLAARVRLALAGREDSEMEVYGCLLFTHWGILACGVNGDELLVQVGQPEAEKTFDNPHTRAWDVDGRRQHGWVLIDSDGQGDADSLQRWIDQALAYVETITPL